MSEELAWAAGLFDGEGNFYCKSGRWPVAQLNMTEFEPVRRFAEVVQVGKVYGPYNCRSRAGHRATMHWASTRRADVQRVVEMLRPWLSKFRIEQAERVLRGEPSEKQLLKGA